MTIEELILTTINTQFNAYVGGAGEPTYGELPRPLNTIGNWRWTLGTNNVNRIIGVGISLVGFYDLYIDFQQDPDDTKMSDFINLVFEFVASGYTPPAAAPGDPIRIDSINVSAISPPNYRRPDAQALRRITTNLHYTVL